MAFKKQNNLYYIADSIADLSQLPLNLPMGTTCFVIEEACEYRITSYGAWIKQVVGDATVIECNCECEPVVWENLHQS